MNRESFLETLKQQYADVIREAYVESEHDNGQIDWTAFNQTLAKLSTAARNQGLPDAEFDDLVNSICTDKRSKLDYRKGQTGQGSSKKAA